MGSFKFQKTLNEEGLVTGLELGGLLVLENSQNIKDEFIAVVDRLSKVQEITVSDMEEIDISCIQIMAAYIRILDRLNVKYQVNWNIDQEQRQLLESIGLSNDFF